MAEDPGPLGPPPAVTGGGGRLDVASGAGAGVWGARRGRVPGSRPAWYAARPGPLRDWVTVLHPPYTAWHLSYVLVGAGLAPRFDVGRLLATLAAFALAVGVAAHALDELRGRPLRTAIPGPTLVVAAAISLAAAVALGGLGVHWVGWGLAGLVVVGAGVVLAYNLEWWGGRLHNDAVFAVAWGALPLLTAYYAQAATLRPAVAAGAVFAGWLSLAQRALSSEARDLRRRVRSVRGVRHYADGSRRSLTRSSLLHPLERGLVALSWSTCALGVALVLARTGH